MFSNEKNVIVKTFIFLNTAGVLAMAYWTGQRVQTINDVKSRVQIIESQLPTAQVLSAKLEGMEVRLRELTSEVSELRRAMLGNRRFGNATPRD